MKLNTYTDTVIIQSYTCVPSLIYPELIIEIFSVVSPKFPYNFHEVSLKNTKLFTKNHSKASQKFSNIFRQYFQTLLKGRRKLLHFSKIFPNFPEIILKFFQILPTFLQFFPQVIQNLFSKTYKMFACPQNFPKFTQNYYFIFYRDDPNKMSRKTKCDN